VNYSLSEAIMGYRYRMAFFMGGSAIVKVCP